MERDLTRRGLLGGALGLGVLGAFAPQVRPFLDRFAPLTGSAWQSTTNPGPPTGTVASPYGPATVGYDTYGVPQIEAPDEPALYFAVGYVQAADRFFQMDLQRRLMGGRLSEVVGARALSVDEFHVKMDFRGAAAANWELLGDTEVGRLVSAYADGVNAAREREPRPHETALLDYEPEPWTPEDTMLMEKQIAWQLTGSFRTLRRELVRRRLGAEAAAQLFPSRYDHDVPIIRDEGARSRTVREGRDHDATLSFDRELVDWLSGFEAPPHVGSNSWVVSGDHTDTGEPLLANDPHLSLMAPPVWYEMNLRTGDGLRVRGVTFPGVPFVIIGENHAGAWGFTNVGADVIDFYTYETSPDGSQYRYDRALRPFETRKEQIPVSDGPDRTVTVKKSHHGPVIERAGQRVGVAWTGLTASATTRAIHAYSRSEGLEDVIAATRDFDTPTQNLVYADRDGNTLYYLTGRLPIRRIDGEPVRGDRVFDGSSGEGEWSGFEPYGISSWEGFVPFEAKPHVRNPDYIGTANQRVVDDPEYYIAAAYADPYRAQRIYDRLDARVGSDDPVDREFMRTLQRDTRDELAAELVPRLLEAAGTLPSRWREALESWEYRMDRDSPGALVFVKWLEHYRSAVFEDRLEAADLDSSYAPSDWVLQHLPADSQWFGDRSRAAVMRDALEAALAEIEEAGYRTYGDYNTTDAIDHPLGLGYLGYESIPMDGSERTVKNYRVQGGWGSSWRMVADMADVSEGVLPGGNSGNPFSPHYDDQLSLWADGEYRRLPHRRPDGIDLRFEGGGRG